MAWFKRTENAKWFDYDADRKKIVDYITNSIHLS